jgi:hypothetical protein
MTRVGDLKVPKRIETVPTVRTTLIWWTTPICAGAGAGRESGKEKNEPWRGAEVQLTNLWQESRRIFEMMNGQLTVRQVGDTLLEKRNGGAPTILCLGALIPLQGLFTTFSSILENISKTKIWQTNDESLYFIDFNNLLDHLIINLWTR